MKGTAVAGATQGLENFSFRHNPVSFGFPKEMGLYLYKNFNGTGFTIPLSSSVAPSPEGRVLIVTKL